MKPCPGNRKLIAWLALGALERQQAASLREHLSRCEGCSRYWEEITNVADKLKYAAPGADIEVSDAFHRQAKERLKAVQPGSILESLFRWAHGLRLSWRLAVPVCGIVGLLLLGIIVSRQAPVSPAPRGLSGQPRESAVSLSDMPPTVANYQLAAAQSFETFDDLLTAQGNKRLAPAPILTASGLALARTGF